LTLYEVAFLPEATEEGHQLPRSAQRALKRKLEYLRSGPFKSYPWLRVKEVGDAPGVWRFHLDRWRVFYKVEGTRIIVGMIERRPTAYSATSKRELRRRL
jgi:mRNA-degrading endonuclease RelE of RelBE toxin-antitoxin system